MSLNRIYITAFILSFISCQNKSNQEKAKSSEFYYYYRIPIYEINPNNIPYAEFHFISHTLQKNENIRQDEVKAITISFPISLTSFSLKDSMKCNFIYDYRNGNIKYKKSIKGGKIEGKLIENELWEIALKTEGIDFKGLISTKNNKDLNYIKIL